MNTKDEIGKRQEFYKRRQGELAIERLGLSQRIEEIDKELAGYATAQEVNALALRDLDTESAIAAAIQQPGPAPEA